MAKEVDDVQRSRWRRMGVTRRHEDRYMLINGASQKGASSVLALALPAEFTQAAVDELGPTLCHQVTDGPWHEIRLDGRAVRSLTSSALGLLVSLAQLGAMHEVRVVISGASPQLAAGLAIGRLIERIHIDRTGHAGYRSTA